MRNLFYIYILLFAATADISAADQTTVLWNKANTYYQQQRYDSAAYLYNKIVVQKPSEPEIYYNLGNAYYRLNDIGHAVLNYERALKYKPSFTKASDNLYLANARIENRITPLPKIFFLQWWDAITAANLSNIYAIIAVIIFLITIIYYSLHKMSYITYDIPHQASYAAICIAVLLLIMSFAGAQKVISENYAVIVNQPTLLYPKQSSSSSSIAIPIGTKVELVNDSDAKYEVKLPDGRKGWIELAAIEKI